MHLGNYPTKVERLDELSTESTGLWVKRDDATNDVYGGNKVRKLEHLIRTASERGARRILTFGAAGSHHVLATTIHGSAAGFEVAAVLTPQPFSGHARTNLQAALGAGLEPLPCPNIAMIPFVLARAVRSGDYVVPPGGSNVTASMGYADAADELAEQVATGCMPQPDVIVVALGSGGTAAGLTAGLENTALTSRLAAVRVVEPPLVTKTSALLLALGVARRRRCRTSLRALSRRFELVRDRLGRGYGHPTAWGEEAMERAGRVGLTLEPTYTAKAFSHALRLVEQGHFRNVLYWHTLSGADLTARAEGIEVPAELEALWR